MYRDDIDRPSLEHQRDVKPAPSFANVEGLPGVRKSELKRAGEVESEHPSTGWQFNWLKNS